MVTDVDCDGDPGEMENFFLLPLVCFLSVVVVCTYCCPPLACLFWSCILRLLLLYFPHSYGVRSKNRLREPIASTVIHVLETSCDAINNTNVIM